MRTHRGGNQGIQRGMPITQRLKHISWLGIFLGLAVMAGGAWRMAKPDGMQRVVRQPIGLAQPRRGSPSHPGQYIEHEVRIAPGQMAFVGFLVMVVGVGVVIASTVRWGND